MNKHTLKFTLITIVASLFYGAFLWFAANAYAMSYPNDGNPVNSNNVADVAKGGYYALLNDQDSWFQIATPQSYGGQVTVTIKGVLPCTAGTTGAQATVYNSNNPNSFYRKAITATKQAAALCSSSITLHPYMSQGTVVAQGTSQPLNAVYLEVQKVPLGNNPGPNYDYSGHEKFTVHVSTSSSKAYVSFAGDLYPGQANNFSAYGSAFDIWMDGTAEYDFQADCNYNFNNGIYLKWSGADVGSTWQNKNITEVLQDWKNGNFQGNVPNSQASGAQLGTSANGSVSWPNNGTGLILAKGHQYHWVWSNVGNSNAMQILVPFSSSSFDAGVQCTSWQLKGYDGGGGGQYYPGQTVHMWHWVNNIPSSASAANYQWQVQGNYQGKGWTSSGYPSGTASSVPPGGNNPYVASYNFTIPNSAPPGAQYCERIIFTHPNGPGSSGWGSSPGTCVSVKGSPTTPTVTATCNDTYAYTNKIAPTQPKKYDSSTGQWVNIDPPHISGASTAPGKSEHWDLKASDYTNSTVIAKTVVNVNNVTPGVNGSVGAPASDPSTGSTVHDWKYVPTNNSISVLAQYKEHALQYWFYKNGSWHLATDKNWRSWEGPNYANTTSIPCLTGTLINPAGACSLHVSGGKGPNGVIEDGQTVTVTGTIYNPPDGKNPPNTTLYSTLPGSSYHLSLTSGGEHDIGTDIPLGGSASTSFPVTANGGPNPSSQTVTAYPDYYGHGPLGPACSITFPVYAPFSLTPHATVSLSPTGEDPSQIINNTWVTDGGAAVSEHVTSSVYDTPVGGSQRTANSTASNGPFNPGDSYLYHNYTYAPISPIQAGDKYCAIATVTYTAGWVGPAGDIAGGTSTNPPNPAQDCQTVNNKPYAQFFGSDVDAGGGFGNNCTTSKGGIITYSDSNNTARPRGSGAQFGAQALDVIEGFNSAILRSSSPTSPTGLSFASTPTTGSPPNATMGGNFGLSNYCVPDYYGEMPNNTPNYASDTISGSIPNGPVQHSGNLTIKNISSGIADGTSDAIYVTGGNVYIDSNIKFASTSWNNIKDIPSLYIIVKGGNIYVDPSVTHLAGMYVAEPASSGSQGVINSCAYSSGPVPLDATFPTSGNGCKNQLTVDGAFVAQQVFLDRTYSSLRYSQSGENPQSGPHQCGSAGHDVPTGGPANAPDCAAEIFNFSPEFYLSQPAMKPNSGPTIGRFDYITSLSPVL